MDFLPPTVARLIADIGQFKAAFGEAEATTTRFEAAQKRMAAAGKVAMAALAVGVAAVAVASVHLAANFDQAMELIHTQAGASQAEVEMLKQKVLALAPAVGIGPEKLAEGLYHIESAGFRGQAALEILAGAAKDAAIGMGDLDSVSQALIGVMASGIGGVRDAADAAAYLNTTVGIGDMRMEKLAAAISTGILPSFRSAGLQMNDFSAALATITDNATPADEAATRLRMTVSLMAAPSRAAVTALASIGIGATQLADDMRKPDGLLGAVMDLKTHLERSGMTASEQNQVIQKAFGGGKTSGAILTLLMETDRLKEKYHEIGTAGERAAKFQESWASQQKQFSQQLHELGASAQVVGIKIGNFLIPKLEEGAKWLEHHIGVVKIAAVVIGSILVAAIAAWTYAVIANTVAMLANPVTWIVLGIVAAIALLVVGIYELVTHWKTVWGFIKRIGVDVWHGLVDAWHWTLTEIEKGVTWVRNRIIAPIVAFFDVFLIGPIKMYLAVLTAAWQFAWGFLSVIVKDFEAVWSAVWAGIEAVAKLVWATVLQPFFALVDKFGIQPLKLAIRALGVAWDWVWAGIKTVVAATWAALKVIWGYVQRDGIDKITAAVNVLKKIWDTVWGGIKAVVKDVWDFIRPIFDKIGGAISGIQKGLSTIGSSPGKAGSWFAHLFGFDAGGPVPGAPGQATLAVVHGGEYVLSRDMLSVLRSGATSGTGAGPPPIGQGQPGSNIIVHAHLYLDGKKIHAALIPVAQQYKTLTGKTGLA